MDLDKHKANWALVAAAIASAIVGAFLYDAAYPTVTFANVLLPRQIVPKARGWLAAAGYNPLGFNAAFSFRTDRWCRRYFEQRFNVGGAAVWGTGLCADVWQWYVRFFQPGQEREFRVFLSPEGGLVELYCAVPELTPAPPLDRKHARVVAERFATRWAGVNLRNYELVRRYLAAKPRREDYGFVWERELRTLGRAKAELKITVTGDQVSHFRRGLAVPKSFRRRDAQSHSTFDIAGETVEYAVYVAALVGAVIWLCLAPSRHQARFTPLALAGGIIALGLAFQRLNRHHLVSLQYPTTASYPLYMLRWVVAGLRWDAFHLLTAILAGVCALHLWSSKAKARPRLLAPAASSLHAVAWAGVRGALLAGAMLGFSVLFTIACREWLYARFPIRAGTTDTLCDALPGYGVAMQLVSAAFRGELVFRVFATAALFRLFKSRTVAVLLTSLLWGATGLNRDVSPQSLSLLEGTVHGLLLSLAFLRFDALTAMAGSYLFAALPLALPLLRANDVYLVLNGVAALGLPLLPALLLLLPKMSPRAAKGSREPVLTYRPLTPEHVAVLCRRAERALELEERSLALLTGSSALALTCFEGSNPIAFGIVTQDGRGRAEVKVLFVSRTHRRRHIGSKLLAELLKRVSDMGIHDVIVQADHRDHGALTFLSAHGFRQTSGVFTKRL